MSTYIIIDTHETYEAEHAKRNPIEVEPVELLPFIEKPCEPVEELLLIGVRSPVN